MLCENIVIIFLIGMVRQPVSGLQTCCPCTQPSQCTIGSVLYSTCDFATWSSWDCTDCVSHCAAAPGVPDTPVPRAVRIRELCCDKTLQSDPEKCFQACDRVFGIDNIEHDSDCASRCGAAPTQCTTQPPWSMPCTDRWSDWINTDTPDSDDGDKESWSAQQQASFCPGGGKITDIECKTMAGLMHYDTGEIMTCGVYTGAVCNNDDNFPVPCSDYLVRYHCTCTTSTSPKAITNIQSGSLSHPTSSFTTTPKTSEDNLTPAPEHCDTTLFAFLKNAGKIVSVCLFVLGLIIGSVSTCLVRWLMTRKQSRSGSVSPGSCGSLDSGVTSRQDNFGYAPDAKMKDMEAAGDFGEISYPTPKMVTFENKRSLVDDDRIRSDSLMYV